MTSRCSERRRERDRSVDAGAARESAEEQQGGC